MERNCFFNSYSVKELKGECKKRGIKGYSKLRKQELRDILVNHVEKTELNNIIEDDNNFFCNPDILSIINSYVVLTLDIRRRLLIENARKNKTKDREQYYIYARLPNAMAREEYAKTLGTNVTDLKKSFLGGTILPLSLEELMNVKDKSRLELWLHVLEYDINPKQAKYVLKKYVKQYYTEIFSQ